MADRGRKTKLTPELQTKFIQALRAGNWIETCCDYVGINPDTYYDWIKRGEEGGARNKIYTDFSEAVRLARSTAEIESVARIRLAGSKGNIKADIFFLERSYPERWGRKRLELTGKDGSALHPPSSDTFDLSALSDEDLEHLDRITDQKRKREQA